MFVNILLSKLVLLFKLESFQLLFCFVITKVEVWILSQLLCLLHSYLIILEQREFTLLDQGLILPIVMSYI